MNNNGTFPLFYLTVMLKGRWKISFPGRAFSVSVETCLFFFFFLVLLVFLNSHPSCFYIVWRCTVCWFTTNCRFTPDFLHQGTRATLVCAPLIAWRATAAPATSGPKSASRCWGRARCAPSRGRKALTAWKSSSAATAPRAFPARCGKTPPPPPNPACTCVRRSEADAAALRVEASVAVRQGALKGIVAASKRRERLKLTIDGTDRAAQKKKKRLSTEQEQSDWDCCHVSAARGPPLHPHAPSLTCASRICRIQWGDAAL